MKSKKFVHDFLHHRFVFVLDLEIADDVIDNQTMDDDDEDEDFLRKINEQKQNQENFFDKSHLIPIMSGPTLLNLG